jgi:hypothetical protein
MLLTAWHLVVGAYRVEVSGWDSSQSFFVEKTELEWSEDSGKQITLRRQLRPGTMIFVRLLQPTETDRSSPVAHEAEYITSDGGGLHHFRLTQVVPRTNAN